MPKDILTTEEIAALLGDTALHAEGDLESSVYKEISLEIRCPDISLSSLLNLHLNQSISLKKLSQEPCELWCEDVLIARGEMEIKNNELFITWNKLISKAERRRLLE